MIKRLFNCETFFAIDCHKAPDEVCALVRDVRGNGVLAMPDLLKKLLLIAFCPRKLSCDHCIENNTAAPDICGNAVVRLPADALWTGVAGRATWGSGHSVVIKKPAQTKVRNFELPVLVNENVLGFQVSVSDVH